MVSCPVLMWLVLAEGGSVRVSVPVNLVGRGAYGGSCPGPSPRMWSAAEVCPV